MILFADSLHDDGASVWAWDDDTEQHSRFRTEIYYWSQNRASLKDMHENRSFCLIGISISFPIYRAALLRTQWISFVFDGN